MTSLLDIAPVKREVEVAGTKLEVGGVSSLGIAYLLQKFPELRRLFGGKSADLTPERLMEAVPEAIAAIIASGCGFPGDARAEAVASSLSVGDQISLVTEILELTMPEGFGPFVAKVRLLLNATSNSVKDVSVAGGKGRATK